jgi:mRNA interferase MazF
MKRPMAISDGFTSGDVVVLPFPYADRLAEKRRPGLVISKPWVVKDHGLLWVAMITSAENERWPSDIPIRDAAKAGLSAPSVIRPVKIATIEAGRVIQKIGRLASADMKKVAAVLSRILP